MTTQQTPPTNTWGAPPPQQPRKPWSTRRIVASAVLAVAIVGGGTAAVLTATSSSATTGGAGGQFGPGDGFGRPGGAGAGLADALHGDFVVTSGSGYATMRLQTGSVTAVSATDISVRSADGYVQSYVVGSGTSVDQGADSIGTVAKGHTVTVIAKVSGQTATASTIEDTSIDSRVGRGGTGQGGGPGGAPPGN